MEEYFNNLSLKVNLINQKWLYSEGGRYLAAIHFIPEKDDEVVNSYTYLGVTFILRIFIQTVKIGKEKQEPHLLC